MTDDTTPPDHDASAHDASAHDAPGDDAARLAASGAVDGESTVAEREFLDDDPLARVLTDRFRVVARSVADVEPPRPEIRERNVMAALAVFDAERVDSSGTTSITAARTRRDAQWWYRRSVGVAAAVLAIGVLGVVGSTVRTGSDSSRSDIPSAADADAELRTTLLEEGDMATADDADDAHDMAGAMEAFSDDSMIADEPMADGFIADDAFSGVIDDLDGLARIGGAALAASRTSEADAEPHASVASEHPCVPAGWLFVGPAVYSGLPVVVIVEPVGAERVQVVDPDTCQVVAETVAPHNG